MVQKIKSIFLKPGKERAIKNRHPWVFSGAILKKDPTNIGDEVVIKDHQGALLAKGHWCAQDGLVVRILSFDEHASFDQDFFVERFRKALMLRRSFLLPNTKTDGFRLIHGEGDGLSGLVCDIYHQTASIQLTNPGLKKSIDILKDFLVTKCSIKQIYFHDAHSGDTQWVLGFSDKTQFKENNLTFHVDVSEGQKTGHFLDQRDNRALLGQLVQGRTVLDNFCNTGGFSVYALAGGAKKVVSIDIAQKVLDIAKKNVAANNFSGHHEAVLADCFDYLRQIKKDEYDAIVLDPPAFAKSSQTVIKASRGYKDINMQAFKAIRRGGIVFSFSCSYHIDMDLFKKIIFAAAKDAERDVCIVRELGQGIDHPVSVYCPQSGYLKGLVLYVD